MAPRPGRRDTDPAPFTLMGAGCRPSAPQGAGTYEFDPASGDVHTAGKLRATADRLEVVAPGLGPMGRVDLVADFDVARLGASVRVARLDTSLSGASPVASVTALQSFEFNTATGELKVARPADDLVGISIKGIPLAWLKGALPRLGLDGSDAKGELVMRAEDGRLVLRTKAPLTASAVAVTASGRPLASGLELSAFVLGDYGTEGWQFQLAPFAVRIDGIKMLSLEARLGRLTGTGRAVKAAGSWSASVPMLLALPVASALPRLSGGDASGSFEASLDATSEVSVKVALQGLASGSVDGAALPSVASDIRADFEAGGKTTPSTSRSTSTTARASPTSSWPGPSHPARKVKSSMARSRGQGSSPVTWPPSGRFALAIPRRERPQPAAAAPRGLSGPRSGAG